MITRTFAGSSDAFLATKTADHKHSISKRRQGLQGRRDLEIAALDCWGPIRHEDAIRRVDNAQTANRLGYLCLHATKRRHHAVQHRQREGDAESAEERTTR